MLKQICHLTSVHPPFDTRVFHKECRSLAEAGYQVTLVAPHSHSETIQQVQIVAVPKPVRRLRRMTATTFQVYRHARRLNADLYHFHDPELIPVGLLLRAHGHKVIYDIHEDMPRNIMSKYWLPSVIRRPTAWIMSAVEQIGAQVFDAIVPATPGIAERFPAHKTMVVQNFPILSELATPALPPYRQRVPAFAYVGSIAETRGAREMIQAMDHLNKSTQARLELAGNYSPAILETELQALPGCDRVNFHGFASRPQVAKLLGGVRAGLVVLHPTRCYPESYPVKMFEYMAVGLPVIASDFPLWRQIIEAAGCGLLVDPLAPEAIAAAMQWILDNPEEAEVMGRRGRKAVEQTYNWEKESVKLLALYGRLLGNYNQAAKAWRL